MIDFHCHFLAGIDDGTETLESAISNLMLSAEEGISVVVLTPHIYPGLYNNSRLPLIESIDAIKENLIRANIPLKIIYGAEVFLDENVFVNINKGNILTINDQNKYVLVELPYNAYPHYIDKIFFELQCKGLTPILAHPERNLQIRKDKTLIRKLLDNKILLQLDAGSIMGNYGEEVQNFARFLLSHRMIQLLGSDYHKKNDGRYAKAIKMIEKITSKEYVNNITLDMPQMILNGKEIEIEYIKPKDSFLGLLR